MNVYDKVGQFGWSGLTDESAAPAGGDVFYVDGNSGNAANASTSGQGDSWDLPFSTVNYAISKCSNDAGNVIVVAADHTETIEDTNDNSVSGTVTDEFCVDKSGITIVGLGRGTRRPTFTLATATDACIDVRVSCTLSNLIFYNTVASNNPMIDVQAGAHGFTLENCMLYEVDNSHQAVVQVCLTTGITDVTIRGCRFYNAASGTQALGSFDIEGATHRLRMYDNVWRGDWNEHVIDADAGAGYDIEIIGNVINQLDASAGLCISLNAATTGIVDDNTCHGGLEGVNPIAAAGCLIGSNLITHVEGVPAGALQHPSQGCVTKTYSGFTGSGAKHTLFNIIGGPVIVTGLVGVVIDTIENDTIEINLDLTPAAPGTDVVLATLLDIDTDPIGTTYTMHGTFGNVLVATTEGGLEHSIDNQFIAPVGTITLQATSGDADATSVIQWCLSYTALAPGAYVDAALTD